MPTYFRMPTMKESMSRLKQWAVDASIDPIAPVAVAVVLVVVVVVVAV